MRFFYPLALSTLLLLLQGACDEPPLHRPLNTEKENSEQKTESENAPKLLLRQYFEALMRRDHKTIDEMLLFSNKFYLREPQPIMRWHLNHIEEMSEGAAKEYPIRPNPIKNDLLFHVTLYTIDEYKKTGIDVAYFLRENKGRWALVNRIKGDSCSSIFLRYGPDALDFEEYPVIGQRKGQYLVKISDSELICVDEKTKVLSQIILPRACNVLIVNNEDKGVYCLEELWVVWEPGGQLHLVSSSETQKSEEMPKVEEKYDVPENNTQE